jgi:hypothetical protein
VACCGGRFIIEAFVKVTREQSKDMSNTNGPTNDGEEVAFPRAEVVVAALTFFSLIICGLCSLIYCFTLLREKQALADEEGDVEAQEIEEERIRIRKEYISKGLNVKEWVPDDLPVESTEGDEGDIPPSGETLEVPQPLEPSMNSSPASCAMGSEDCDSSVAGDEETDGCAICLSQFKPQQLVCESNNSSCQHIFHKDCMVDWLMKDNGSCPMCREVYLIKTV